jgi:hypothetical protein
MEAMHSSETSFDFHRTTRRYVSEDMNPYSDGYENLRYNKQDHILNFHCRDYKKLQHAQF